MMVNKNYIFLLKADFRLILFYNDTYIREKKGLKKFSFWLHVLFIELLYKKWGILFILLLCKIWSQTKSKHKIAIYRN